MDLFSKLLKPTRTTPWNEGHLGRGFPIEITSPFKPKSQRRLEVVWKELHETKYVATPSIAVPCWEDIPSQPALLSRFFSFSHGGIHVSQISIISPRIGIKNDFFWNNRIRTLMFGPFCVSALCLQSAACQNKSVVLDLTLSISKILDPISVRTSHVTTNSQQRWQWKMEQLYIQRFKILKNYSDFPMPQLYFARTWKILGDVVNPS